MEKVDQLEMEPNDVETTLEPYDCRIDEIAAHYESYRERLALEQLLIKHKLKENLDLNEELDKLRTSIENLRMGLQEFQKDHQQSQFQDVNAIIEAPLIIRRTPEDKSESSLEKQLVIRCGSNECIFDSCQRRVDKQLLLLHYITDHSGDETISIEGSHYIKQGQQVIFSFHPKHFDIRDNQVLGVLSYGRRIDDQEEDKEAYIPIVVLICKIAAHVSLSNKNLVECLKVHTSIMDQVYLIWLVTPHDKVQLSATLCLYGRDLAQKANTVVGVSWLNHSDDDCHFMPVDNKYWRLSFAKMRQISNGFRDEVNLEISLTESDDKSQQLPMISF